MCDSISIEVCLDDMPDEEYLQCRFPSKDRNDTDDSHIEFRKIYPTSPLTGAGFKITPLGMPADGGQKKRKQHGRITGYLVEVNPPACAIGHNRMLVNGVPQSAMLCLWLLEHWLATNGCTEEGLSRINWENAVIVDVTLTFLFPFDSETAAREALRKFRVHTEAFLNLKRKGRTVTHKSKVAFSYPPKAAPNLPEKKYTYTSYVKLREFVISAYVKELNQRNAFLIPLDDESLEAKVQEYAIRTLRLENRVHGKWLAENDLNRIEQWANKPEAYEKVFNVVRKTLRLDEGLRSQRIKKTTIPTLKLSAADKELLAWHISGKDVRCHPRVLALDTVDKQNKYFSAAKRRIYNETKIDIATPWEVQKGNLSPYLSELLEYPGEFVPPAHLAPFVFSRVSVPQAIARLKALVEEALKSASDHASINNRPAKSTPSQPGKAQRRGYGIGSAPVDPNEADQLNDVEDDWSVS